MNNSHEMTTTGWVFLISFWGIISVLCVYCFYKVFSASKKE